jgi:Family of unknown function (DUF6504)
VSLRFVSEAIAPGGDFDVEKLARGEPGLPEFFVWRDETLRVAALRRTWRSTRTDRGDVYVKRHWFDVLLDDGKSAVVYFERQARRGTPRWWLYTIGNSGQEADPAAREGAT